MQRPVIFSAAMVRAILDGRKTQTRRVVKPRYSWMIEERDDGTPWPWYPDYVTGGEWDGWVPCPYGQPGHRLWVRETHAIEDDGRVVYREDRAACYPRGDFFWLPSDYQPRCWRPSIHMPRWASRITLQVTGVRVERLQDISQGDAEAEGLRKFPFEDSFAWAYKDGDQHGHASGTGAFRALWESINGPGSWDANPWVWVVEFKVITPSLPVATPRPDPGA